MSESVQYFKVIRAPECSPLSPAELRRFIYWNRPNSKWEVWDAGNLADRIAELEAQLEAADNKIVDCEARAMSDALAIAEGTKQLSVERRKCELTVPDGIFDGKLCDAQAKEIAVLDRMVELMAKANYSNLKHTNVSIDFVLKKYRAQAEAEIEKAREK